MWPMPSLSLWQPCYREDQHRQQLMSRASVGDAWVRSSGYTKVRNRNRLKVAFIYEISNCRKFSAEWMKILHNPLHALSANLPNIGISCRLFGRSILSQRMLNNTNLRILHTLHFRTTLGLRRFYDRFGAQTIVFRRSEFMRRSKNNHLQRTVAKQPKTDQICQI